MKTNNDSTIMETLRVHLLKEAAITEEMLSKTTMLGKLHAREVQIKQNNLVCEIVLTMLEAQREVNSATTRRPPDYLYAQPSQPSRVVVTSKHTQMFYPVYEHVSAIAENDHYLR